MLERFRAAIENHRGATAGAGLGILFYAAIHSAGSIYPLFNEMFFAEPFVFVFGRFLNGKPLESIMWLIHLFAATTWAVFGAFIGYLFDRIKRPLIAGAWIFGIITILGALTAPIFPWGLNLIQVIPLHMHLNKLNALQSEAERSPQDLDRVLGRLLDALERNPGRGPIENFKGFIQNRQFPQEIADHHAAKLVSVLRKNGDAIASMGGADIVQFLCFFSKAPETKAYLLDLFAGPPSTIRNQAIRFLFWTNTWVGDHEIFQALSKIYRKEGDVDRSLLSAMAKVDQDGAREILRQALLDAADERTFQGLASIVNMRDDESLFETEITLIPKFHVNPVWAMREQWEKYIRKTEGQKLKTAFEALCAVNSAFPMDVVIEKEHSKDPVSRASAYKLVQCWMKVYFQSGGPGVEELKVASRHDPDPAARQAAKEAWTFWCKEHPNCEK